MKNIKELVLELCRREGKKKQAASAPLAWLPRAAKHLLSKPPLCATTEN